MGNALLDFVMTLARDSAAAARYATDPAGALAAAGLPGVTPADVDGLIPMVTDSLAMSTPDWGAPAAAHDPNVWASGAAAVAFEAFGLDKPLSDSGAVRPVVNADRSGAGTTADDLPVGLHADQTPADQTPADQIAVPVDPDPVDPAHWSSVFTEHPPVDPDYPGQPGHPGHWEIP